MSTRTAPPLKEMEGESGWAQPIAKESLADRAHIALRSALMRGQLKPGEKLLLRPTSQRFGVSATPMREALLRLVSVEALTLDGRGTVVVPTLTHAQLQEIRSIRLDLEGRAAATAAISAAPADIDALEAIPHIDIARCHKSEAFLEAVDLNTQFHLTLAASPVCPFCSTSSKTCGCAVDLSFRTCTMPGCRIGIRTRICVSSARCAMAMRRLRERPSAGTSKMAARPGPPRAGRNVRPSAGAPPTVSSRQRAGSGAWVPQAVSA